MRSGSLGHHRAVDKEEEFSHFRSREAGILRHGLGAIASERVFYGENSTGVSGDLATATQLAALMVGVWGMGPDNLPPHRSRLAVNIGEYLISIAAIGGSELLGEETPAGKVPGNGRVRQAAAGGVGVGLPEARRVRYGNTEAHRL